MQFTLTNQQDRACQLHSAILVYQQATRYHGEQAMTFATVHDIQHRDRGQPTIKPGRPMSMADLRNLASNLEASQTAGGTRWLDTSMLAMGNDRMIWWTEAGQQPMFFQTDTIQGRGSCPVPALVWMYVHEDGLYVYALKDSKRPEPGTQLYQAPLLNVWARGKVCVGNTVMPPKETRWSPDVWHRVMWESNFTHPNFTEKDRLTKGIDPVDFWAGQLKRPSKVFPTRVLVKVPVTIQDLLVQDVGKHLMNKLGKAKGER